MSEKTKMVRFNVKNVKYAIKSELDVYGTVSDLAYANAITLESNFSEKVIYGDGVIIGVLNNDKGKTGSLGVINIEDHYEVDCGRALAITEGLADIQQIKSVEQAIYYEVDAFKDNAKIVIKNWLLGCFTSRANESYNQTEEDVSINFYEYPMKIMGETLMDSTGAEEYTDTNGNTLKVFRITSYPDDAGYETFGDEVPTPKALGE